MLSSVGAAPPSAATSLTASPVCSATSPPGSDGPLAQRPLHRAHHRDAGRVAHHQPIAPDADADQQRQRHSRRRELHRRARPHAQAARPGRASCSRSTGVVRRSRSSVVAAMLASCRRGFVPGRLAARVARRLLPGPSSTSPRAGAAHLLHRSHAKNTKAGRNHNARGPGQRDFRRVMSPGHPPARSAGPARRCRGSTARGSPRPGRRGRRRPGAARAPGPRSRPGAAIRRSASSASARPRGSARTGPPPPSVASTRRSPPRAARRSTEWTRAWAYCT